MCEGNSDSYCGLCCGACSIAMHGATGRADGLTTRLGFVPKDDLFCGGCKSGNAYIGCRTCNLRYCARRKSVTYCIDCADYPCERYKAWQSTARFFPHSHDAAYNLEVIKSKGVDRWLEIQKIRWSCPICGRPFSWYASKCNKCRQKLTSQTYKISGWRKLVCSIILSIAYWKERWKRKIRC